MSSSDPPVAATPPVPDGIPKAQPTEAEIAALKQSGPLVRFASENIEKLDPACILAISEAQASRARGEWTPAISQNFWSAFNCLCTPIRNWVRVLLGALMGVVVGLFSGISHQISLPPLAVAFLAGYGVEAVFSIFDGFITRMRQPSASEK
jgi:hypothetical protein